MPRVIELKRPGRKVGWNPCERPRRKARRAKPSDLLALDSTITALAIRLRADVHHLREWETEDLVQEVFLKAMLKLEKFRGDSSFKTWVVTIARNHLLTMANSIRLRPRPGATGEEVALRAAPEPCPVADELRRVTEILLRWLDENPGEIQGGWQVLNLLLWNHGNFEYVALAMCIHTGSPWTVERTRNVVKKIRQTADGRVLCSAIGLTNDDER